jgi:peptidoglycan/LPS O-acetylase OafA/YrhL
MTPIGIPVRSNVMRIPSLDGVRAVSICLVITAHLCGTAHSPNLTWIWTFGDIGNLGVRIFFVISGFLITTLLHREADRTGRYSLFAFLCRRELRIVPPFAAYVGAIALAGQLGILAIDSGDVQSAVTFTSNFDARHSWYVGHLWSLSVEQQFYLAWPVLLVVVGLRRTFWLACAGLAVGPLTRVAVHVLIPEWRWAVDESFPTVLDTLASGCLLAALHERLIGCPCYVRLLRSRAVAVIPFVIVLLNRWMPHVAFSYTVGQSVMNILIALMLQRVMMFPNSTLGRILNAGPMVTIGAVSYSLYLWQQPFLNPHSSLAIAAFPLNIVLAVSAAFLSYYLVEQPAMKLSRCLGAKAVGTSKASETRVTTPRLFTALGPGDRA